MFVIYLRRYCYDLYERVVGDTCPRRETSLNFAKRIIIHGNYVDSQCSIQYPCATELALTGRPTGDKCWLMGDFSLNIPLVQITQLCILYSDLDIDHLIMILYHLPNLDYLSFYSKPLLQIASRSAKQEAEMADLQSKSKITRLESGGGVLYTLDEIRCLVSLCPRLEYLEADLGEDMLDWIAGDLLPKKTTPHIFSCCFWNATRVMMRKLQAIVDQMENFHDDYLMQFFNGYLYLWW
jgi:hypothetical protein